MIAYLDFLPRQTKPAGFLSPAEHEPFDAAVEAANAWLRQHQVQVINIETVVLPNIFSKFEEGSADSSLGTSGESPSHWHQFVRVWYRTDAAD
jgi:hypothetical protein